MGYCIKRVLGWQCNSSGGTVKNTNECVNRQSTSLCYLELQLCISLWFYCFGFSWWISRISHSEQMGYKWKSSFSFSFSQFYSPGTIQQLHLSPYCSRSAVPEPKSPACERVCISSLVQITNCHLLLYVWGRAIESSFKTLLRGSWRTVACLFVFNAVQVVNLCWDLGFSVHVTQMQRCISSVHINWSK